MLDLVAMLTEKNVNAICSMDYVISESTAPAGR